MDFIQPDAPRVGGITQFLKIATMAEQKYLKMAPHFAMEIHLHLAAAYAHDTWVEHFDWLDPLFNEHLEIKDGRMMVSDRPGFGFTLSEQALAWRVDTQRDRQAALGGLRHPLGIGVDLLGRREGEGQRRRAEADGTRGDVEPVVGAEGVVEPAAADRAEGHADR